MRREKVPGRRERTGLSIGEPCPQGAQSLTGSGGGGAGDRQQTQAFRGGDQAWGAQDHPPLLQMSRSEKHNQQVMRVKQIQTMVRVCRSWAPSGETRVGVGALPPHL